jgi:hypothetical protein
MCLVCGNLSGEPHWTERRPDSRPDVDPAAETRRRRDRYRRIRLVNRVLAAGRLTVHDEPGATRYVLTNGRGSSELLEHLGEIWSAAERQLGRPIDPLDDALLLSLGSGGENR